MKRRALLLGLVATPALGQTLDLNQGGPVEITATDGIEWRQQEQVVIARGNARAVRDGVTVEADRLLARYRPRGGAANQQGGGAANQQGGGAAPAQPAAAAGPGAGGEIWRLEAEGRVRITSPSETAEGERAVYDIDQAVMVLSGRGLSLTTPDQRITARDSLEYWPQRRMAVARGAALVVTSDDRRIAAETLVAYFLEAPVAGAPGSPTPTPAATPRPAGAAGLPAPGEGSRIERVEAFGQVEIRTPEEVVRGDRGVYNPQTGLARLVGQVRITRANNQLNGQEAIVNLRTGVSRLVSTPGARVQGLVVPQAQQPGQPAVPAPRPIPAQAPR
jgi:lipopolysaccharide export system protein LptA